MSRSEPLQDLFVALADDTRLRILSLVAEQEVCVCFFIEALDAPQSKVSRHLAFLRKAGLVKALREGKWMHYSLALPEEKARKRVVEAAIAAMSDDPRAKRDRERLKKACCGPQSLIQVMGAPAPVRV
jgi:ArsR family transcriptional regulator